jgi:hypothetical protein
MADAVLRWSGGARGIVPADQGDGGRLGQGPRHRSATGVLPRRGHWQEAIALYASVGAADADRLRAWLADRFGIMPRSGSHGPSAELDPAVSRAK